MAPSQVFIWLPNKERRPYHIFWSRELIRMSESRTSAFLGQAHPLSSLSYGYPASIASLLRNEAMATTPLIEACQGNSFALPSPLWAISCLRSMLPEERHYGESRKVLCGLGFTEQIARYFIVRSPNNTP